MVLRQVLLNKGRAVTFLIFRQVVNGRKTILSASAYYFYWPSQRADIEQRRVNRNQNSLIGSSFLAHGLAAEVY
jgi:hypothetical protein